MKQRLIKYLKLLVIFAGSIAAISLLSGCFFYNYTAAYPIDQRFSQIVAETEMPGLVNRPVNAQIIKDRRVQVIGHLNNNAWLFAGVPASAATVSYTPNQDAFDVQSVVEKNVSQVDYDWKAHTESAIRLTVQRLGNDLSFSQDKSVLSLSAYGIYNLQGREDAKLFIGVITNFKDDSGKKIWGAKYFMPIKNSYTFDPINGWGNEEIFRSEVDDALKNLVDIILRQAAENFTVSNVIKVNMPIPYGLIEHPAIPTWDVLYEDGDYFLLRLKSHDLSTIAGYHFVHKDEVDVINEQLP